MSFDFDLEVGAYDVIGRDVILDRRICDDGARGSALRAADDPDVKSVFIKELHDFHHRKIEVVDVAHIVKALRLLLTERHDVIVKFADGHARVRFGEVPRQRFIGGVPRLDRSRDFFKFSRNALGMIDKTIFDKHHRIVVRVVRFAHKRSVHVEHGDAVFFGDEIF